MELIIMVIVITVGTAIVLFQETDEILPTPLPQASAPEYWATGDRYLGGKFIIENELEEMRTRLNSTNSKF